MTEQEFKQHYVATFMATYTALHYDENCQMDRHDENKNHSVAEDAVFLSHYAWAKYKEEMLSGGQRP